MDGVGVDSILTQGLFTGGQFCGGDNTMTRRNRTKVVLDLEFFDEPQVAA